MFWKRIIAFVIALALIVSAVTLPKVYHMLNRQNGDLIWSSSEAYVFVLVAQYGYSSSYLGFLIEVVREIFPFGASAPDKKHYYTVVLHITPEAIQRYSVDNFQIGSPAYAMGQDLYAGNLVGMDGPMKWSGTHFEPATAAEQKETLDAYKKGEISTSPSYDNIGAWSRRPVAGPVVSNLPNVAIEKNAEVTVELGGKPMTFIMNSGYDSHEAFIDLSRPGKAPERIWHLSERACKSQPCHLQTDLWKRLIGRNRQSDLRRGPRWSV
jgi:hypothetical protein